jgi:hypothetical protein
MATRSVPAAGPLGVAIAPASVVGVGIDARAALRVQVGLLQGAEAAVAPAFGVPVAGAVGGGGTTGGKQSRRNKEEKAREVSSD